MREVRDTTVGFGASEFPTTDLRMLRGFRSELPDVRRGHLEEYCARYWKPVYAYFRALARGGIDEARDLTQDFFCRLAEENLLSRFEPGRGRFRAFLKEVLRNRLLDHHRRETRLRRGGGRLHLSINTDQVECEAFLEEARRASPEQLFDRQWMLDLLDRGIERLRAELGAERKRVVFDVYRAYELVPEESRPTYAAIAARLGIKEHDVTNHLHAARLRLRRIVKEEVARYESGPDLCDLEYRELFGS